MSEINTLQKKDYYKFGLLSFIGFMIFLCPIPDIYSDSITLVIGIVTTAFHNLLGHLADYIIVATSAVAVIGTIIISLVLPHKFDKEGAIYKLFYAKGLNFAGRIAGGILLIMVFMNIGPELLLNPAVGGTMLSLCVVVGIELIPAIILMPLLVDFGLMEFAGTLVNKLIRPLFHLPGRSSVDLLASWVGMVEMGLIVTDEQYANGYYTKREAISIATCFTATGVAFWLVCGEMTGVTQYLVHFFAAIFLVGLICAMVCIRIPPLSRIPDEFMVENDNNKDPIKEKPEKQNIFSYACSLGAKRAKSSMTMSQLGRKIVYQNFNILLTLVPLVMVIGVIALALVEYTPLLDWIGYPFSILLGFFGIPEASMAGSAIVSGFFDMFLPMVLIAEATSIQVKFVVTVVGLTQIVFVSEVISYLLNSRIPVKFSHMVLIFLERTIVAILVLVPFTYLFGIVD